jgi:hypothetical protein
LEGKSSPIEERLGTGYENVQLVAIKRARIASDQTRSFRPKKRSYRSEVTGGVDTENANGNVRRVKRSAVEIAGDWDWETRTGELADKVKGGRKAKGNDGLSVRSCTEYVDRYKEIQYCRRKYGVAGLPGPLEVVGFPDPTTTKYHGPVSSTKFGPLLCQAPQERIGPVKGAYTRRPGIIR